MPYAIRTIVSTNVQSGAKLVTSQRGVLRFEIEFYAKKLAEQMTAQKIDLPGFETRFEVVDADKPGWLSGEVDLRKAIEVAAYLRGKTDGVKK